MLKKFKINQDLNGIKLFSTELLNFVPKHDPVRENDLKQLETFIVNSSNMLILTGAGISTESGIPDYRSAKVGLYARTNHRPVLHQEFIKSATTRQRYWARNFVGWPKFSKFQPNSVHQSVRRLESEFNKVSCVVTQNVDNLHSKAGSKNVIELHGTGYRVICLNCDVAYDRFYIQEKLQKLNPSFTETSDFIRPDGDVDISREVMEKFVPPLCENCDGPLKPDIVFFGDNVPKRRVEKVRNILSESDSLLVLGSSLSVFSGYRIVLQAVDERKKIAIVNIGPTRADDLATLKISAKCGDILPKIC